jgi:hypothetical protein
MMLKSAQAGVGGGGAVRSTPACHYIYHHVRTNLWCTLAPAERADALPLFLLYPYVWKEKYAV